jgi:hypothetical protein
MPLSDLTGTWVLEKSENFDEFMKEVGVSFFLRKAGNITVPTIIITIDGQNWSIKIRSTFKNNDDDFVIDVEKDDGKWIYILFQYSLVHFLL